MDRKYCVATLMACIAGCLSVSEPNYYTLDMRASGRVEALFVLESVRIRPGEAVSRREIMIRTSPTEIEYYATQLWAADLGEQLSEKLKTEFGPTDASAAAVNIDGDLLAFEQVDTNDGADARVKLDLLVTVDSDTGGEPHSFSKIYETVVTAEAQAAPAIVEALSRGLEKIAAELAEDLARERSR